MPRKSAGKTEILVRLYYIRDYKNSGVPNICGKAMLAVAYCNGSIDSLIAKYHNSQTKPPLLRWLQYHLLRISFRCDIVRFHLAKEGAFVDPQFLSCGCFIALISSKSLDYQNNLHLLNTRGLITLYRFQLRS